MKLPSLGSLIVWLLLPFLKGAAGVLRILAAIFRPALRFLGSLCLMAATIALTADLTRWQAGQTRAWVFESLMGHIKDLAPATLKGFGETISGALHPWVWDPVMTGLIGQPAWLLFLLLGLWLVYAGRERRGINIFVN